MDEVLAQLTSYLRDIWRRRWIGLGACTSTCGRSTCEKATSLMLLTDRNVVLPRSSAWFSLIDMVIPQHRKCIAAP